MENQIEIVNVEESKEIEIVGSEKRIRSAIVSVENKMAQCPGAMFGDCFPLEHTFADGSYIRKITIPGGILMTSKLHKITHPYFILQGDVSVITDHGIQRIKAPYFGITKAGTKRILFTHKETIWYTVHVTNETDLKKIEEQIIAKTFDEIGLEIDKTEDSNMVEFIEHIKEGETNVPKIICSSL
jgi:hypothetical protein